MRCTQSSTVVSVEELVEVDIVSEMRVSVQLGVTAVDSSSTMFVSAEEVDQSVLDLLGTSGKVHVLDREPMPQLQMNGKSKLTSPLPVGHST
jgi:hypothetical protein